MIEFLGRVQNGVVVPDQPLAPWEGRRVRIQEFPSDESQSTFWTERSLEDLAIEQEVPRCEGLNCFAGEWPDADLNDGFEEELRLWRGRHPETE